MAESVDDSNTKHHRKPIVAGLSLNILFLGITSFINDMSTEIILPVLPLFLITLGGTGIIVGLIGGVSDALVAWLKLASGYLADRTGTRKPYVFAGYATSSTVKLLFPTAQSWIDIAVLNPAERTGKGLRTAPRDAMIAESTEKAHSGRAFGYHRAMDSGGALVGSLLAFLFLWVYGMGYREILFIAALIGFLALIPILFVQDIKRKKDSKHHTKPLQLRGLPRSLQFFILVAALFAFGNFSYMFFILRARDLLNISPELAVNPFLLAAFTLLVYVVFNLVYSVTSLPIGIISDRIGKKPILAFGYALFAIACLLFGFVPTPLTAWVGFALYGLMMAFVNGTQRAFASDLAQEENRAFSLGGFHGAIGLMALPSSLVAGILWELLGAEFTFLFGIFVSVIVMVLLYFIPKK
ncbi:MAG: MFS transporter [Candidatus Ranarchaeia archaeon]